MIIEEIKAHAQEADLRLSRLYDFLKIETYKQEMAELEKVMARPDFWDDKEKAQETVQKLSSCKNTIEPYQNLVKEVEDFHTIAELAGEDESFLAEADGAWKSLSEHLDKIEDIKGEQKEIAWGSQIRSYVFMPYTLVKDTRTGYESGNIANVMDGDIDGFINAYLKMGSIGSITENQD